jgi:hypothetical protein
MDKHKYIREDRARERWDVYLYSVALYILDRSSGIKEEVRAEASCNMNMKDLVTGRRQPEACVYISAMNIHRVISSR